MKHIITILLAAICLASFGQNAPSTKSTASTVISSQDTSFFVMPVAAKKKFTTVNKKKDNDDGYKLVEPKAQAVESGYKLVEPSRPVFYYTQSNDTIYYENQYQYQNSYQNNNTATMDIDTKLRQLQYEQANTNLSYNDIKYLQSLPYLK